MRRIALVAALVAALATPAMAQKYNGNGCNFNGCAPGQGGNWNRGGGNWNNGGGNWNRRGGNWNNGNTYNYNTYNYYNRRNNNNWNNGAAIGLGIAGGMLLGGILAQPGPVYAAPPPPAPAPRCWWQPQYDYYGNYQGSVKTCY